MLIFPFDAEINYSDKPFLKVGDQVQMISIVGLNIANYC
ncbi:MAG: hypothetical protein ACPL7B_13895 [Candidatus Poribacteria bacterium]